MIERLGRTGRCFIGSGYKIVSLRVKGANTSKIRASKVVPFCKSKAAFCSDGAK